VTPVEFRGDLWLQKTRVHGLSCGVVCVILRLAVLVEHRLVTDGQTDGHRAMASTADAQHRAVKTSRSHRENGVLINGEYANHGEADRISSKSTQKYDHLQQTSRIAVVAY